MREILFRGKRIDNGIWISGSLFRSCNKYYIMPLPIIPPRIEVDPETVGQFTGVTDKNGKMIFEGDIVRKSELYGNVLGEIQYLVTRFRCRCVNNEYPDLTFSRFDEVVGNIHDNPELLGGTDYE